MAVAEADVALAEVLSTGVVAVVAVAVAVAVALEVLNAGAVAAGEAKVASNIKEAIILSRNCVTVTTMMDLLWFTCSYIMFLAEFDVCESASTSVRLLLSY